MSDIETKPKPRWMKFLAVAVLLLLIVVIGAAAFVNLYFTEDYFKSQITKAIKDSLGRDSTIKSVKVSIFGGKAVIEDLKIQNASERFKEKETIRVEKLEASFSPLGLAMGGGKDIRNIQIDIEKPELIVEKVGFWPMEKSNLDDILIKMSEGPPGSWPKQTGLKGLSFTVNVKNGIVSYRDSEIRIGLSRIEGLNLTAKQDGLGKPVELTTNFKFITKTNEKGGTAELKGRLEWIDAAGQIDPKGFKNILFDSQLQDFDIPQITRHLHMEKRVLGDRYVATLGKPVNGALKIDAPSLNSITLSGTVDTDGIISLWDGEKRVAGDVSGMTTVEVKTGWINGSLENGPATFTTVLAANRAALRDASPKLLELKATSTVGSDQSDEFHVVMKCAEALYETDIAQALNLKGVTSQPLTGEIKAKNAPGGVIEITGDIKTVGGYVMIQGIKQPTQLEFTFNVLRTPSDKGVPEKAQLAFTATSDAFKISTLQPAQIIDPSNPERVSVDAQTRILVDGRTLWKQFGPVLNVFGLGTPLHEQLEGQLNIGGKGGKITGALDGTLQRQNGTPAPIKLNGRSAFDGEALKEANGQPFINFELRLASATDKSLDIQLAGTGTRTGPQEVFDLSRFTTESDLAALNVLNQRFGAYASVLLGAKYQVAGTIKQSGKSKVVRTLDAEGKVTSSELTLSTEVQVSNLSLSGPALVENGPPLNWSDPQLGLSLQVQQKSQGETSLLKIPSIALNGQGISFTGELAEANLVQIGKASKLEKGILSGWVQALPALKLDARVGTETFARLKALGVFAQFSNEPLLAGDVAIKASYDPATKKLDLQQAQLNGPNAKAKLLLKDADAAALAAVLDVSPLSFAKLFAVLPGTALDVQLDAVALSRLQALKLVPEGTALQGVFTLNAAVTPETKAAAVQVLSFQSDSAKVTMAAPSVALAPLGEFLDLAADKRTPAAMLRTLPSAKIAFTFGAGAFAALNNLKLLPPEPAVSGEMLGGIVEYDATQDTLGITKLTFIRGNNSPFFVVNALVDGRVTALKDLANKLSGPPEALLAHVADMDISIAADVPLLCAYLKKQKTAEAFADDVAAGVVRFGGPISIKNVKVKSPAPNSYDILATIDGAVSYFPRPAAGQAAPTIPKASLAGVFGTGDVPLKITLGASKKIAGVLALDNADIRAVVDEKFFTYIKPANQPCKLAFDATLNENGSMQVASTDLAGGPLGFALKNLSTATANDKTSVKLERLDLREGPLTGVLSGIDFDPAQDRLQASLDLETLDLAKLTPFLNLPPTLKMGGVFNKISAAYAGSVSGFEKGFSGTDKFNLSIARLSAEVTGTQGSDVVRATLAGDLNTKSDSMSSKALVLGIVHTVGGSQLSSHQIQTSLGISSKNPGESLLTAASKPGLPLSVSLPVVSQGAINGDMLLAAIDVLSRAASTGSTSAPAKPAAGFDGIKHLRVATSVQAPALTFGNLQLSNVKIENAVLDELQLTAKNVNAVAFNDGAINIPTLQYNLGTKLHSSQFTATNLNLNLLTGKPATKEDYEVFGRATANGVIAGIGFEQADMASWNGSVTSNINDLILIKNEGKADSIFSAKTGIGVGGKVLSIFGGMVPVGSEHITDLGDALNIYAGDFGLFLNRLEFEPITLVTGIEKGRANIERGLVKGKNNSAGLMLVYSGAISLPERVFDPQFNVRIAGLPAGTEKKLKMDQLDTADREKIRQEFADLKFPNAILRGPLSAPKTEGTDLGLAFRDLKKRIDRLIAEKKERESAAGQPAGTSQGSNTAKTDQPPPKKEEKNPIKGIIDLFGR